MYAGIRLMGRSMGGCIPSRGKTAACTVACTKKREVNAKKKVGCADDIEIMVDPKELCMFRAPEEKALRHGIDTSRVGIGT